VELRVSAVVTQIDELLIRLASADLDGAEGALARLAIEGARTIEPLLAAYSSTSDGARGRMLRLLERVPDPRSMTLLETTASQGPEGLRRLAVRALGAQPASRSSRVLTGILPGEQSTPVRAEIVGLLARMSTGEVPEVLDPVLDILFDPAEPGEVRRAALTALAGLRDRQALQILQRLAEQSGSRLSNDVRELLKTPHGDPLRGLTSLMAEPPSSAENMAVTTPPMRLMNIPHVLSTLETHGDDPETANRCVRALDTLSPEARRDLAARLDPSWPLPVMDGVLDTLRGVRDRPVLSSVADLARGLAARIRSEPDPDRRQHLEARRARAHRLIAGGGSRLAVADLKEAFREADPLPHDLVRALATIGQADDLSDLLVRHDDADPWMQKEILQAAGEILAREPPRRLRRAVAALPARHGEIIRSLITSPGTAAIRHSSAPRPGETP
jgi:hypothetical protein